MFVEAKLPLIKVAGGKDEQTAGGGGWKDLKNYFSKNGIIEEVFKSQLLYPNEDVGDKRDIIHFRDNQTYTLQNSVFDFLNALCGICKN